MGQHHPYLQRRGDRLFFRIGVPVALRPVVRLREFTAALKTGDRASAVPVAFELAAIAHRLFHELNMTTDKAAALLAQARAKLQIDQVRSEMGDEVVRAHQARIAALQDAKQERDADRRALQGEIDALKHALDAALKSRDLPPSTRPEAPSTPASEAPSRRLSYLVNTFLSGYAKERKAPMFKKHQAALALLNELHGKKSIDHLKQADIVDYFKSEEWRVISLLRAGEESRPTADPGDLTSKSPARAAGTRAPESIRPTSVEYPAYLDPRVMKQVNFDMPETDHYRLKTLVDSIPGMSLRRFLLEAAHEKMERVLASRKS